MTEGLFETFRVRWMQISSSNVQKCTISARALEWRSVKRSKLRIETQVHLHHRLRYSPFGITTGWWSRIPTRRVLVATIQTRHFVMGYYTRQRRPISLVRGGASFRRRPLLGLMRRARSFLLCARYVVPSRLPRDAPRVTPVYCVQRRAEFTTILENADNTAWKCG